MIKAKELGDYIRKTRNRRDLSLNELSRRCGVDSGYLSRLERGEKSNPSAEVLAKIAMGLKIPLATLYERAGLSIEEVSQTDIKETLEMGSKVHWGGRELTEDEKRLIQRIIEAAIHREEAASRQS